MASTFTTLGIEKMATGENAGTWGDKTNTNLDIVNTAISGYVEQAVTSGGTTALSITDGAATSTAQNAVIKLTGTISGNSIVTVPDSVEKVYIVTNGTSGAYTVQFKTASGSGVTFGVSEKTTKLLYSDGTNIVDAGFSGGGDLDGTELVLDADGDTSITADTDDQIDIKIAGTDQLTIKDGALSPVTDNDIDLGTSTLEFKDAFFDGTVTSDAFAGPLTGNVTGNVSGTAATVTTAAQSNITSLGTLTTLTVDDITINGSTISDAGDFTLDVEGDIILDANGADVFLKDAGTTYGSLTNTSGNLIVKSGTTTALTFSGANVTVAGDLTVSGDDITMGTNTAGNLLVADGTNFNSIAVGGLSEISTVANDDVFLAVDTSGGGLKRIARSAVVSGLATSGAITDIVEDTSPQLGGNLDTNSANILIDDAHFIADESGNEQIIFQTTGSAVNQFDVTNAASGSGPQLSATGGDSNIDLNILAKGTGHVTVVGNSTSGTIQFNCESNSHGQIIRAQPHSASATNIMLLPEGADSTLVSLVSTDTLTNKTLTSPVINTGTFGTSILPTSADGTSLGSASKEFSDLFLADSSTIQFGNDQDTTLTHTDGTGLTLNSTNKLCFNDASQFIQGASATVLDIAATDEIELTATLIDVVGNLAGSGTGTFGGILKTDDATEATSTTDGSLQTDGGLSVVKDVILGDDVTLLSDAAVLKFGADAEVTLTHVHNDGLLLNTDMQLQFRDSAINIRSDADGDLDINADDEIELNSTLIDINGNVEISGTATTTGVHTFTAVPVFPNNTVETADIQDNAITLAKLAGGTDGNIISFDASGDPVAIATGSDGQVLTSTGAGSPPAFESPAGGGSFTKLLTTTLSGAAAGIIFNSTYVTTTYNTYLLIWNGFTPVTDNHSLAIALSVDNGSNFATHQGMFVYNHINGAAAFGANGNLAFYPCNTDMKNVISDGGASGHAYIHNTASTTQPKYIQGGGVQTNSTATNSYGFASYGKFFSTTAVNYIKLYEPEAGGNFQAGGTATLYGVTS